MAFILHEPASHNSSDKIPFFLQQTQLFLNGIKILFNVINELFLSKFWPSSHLILSRLRLNYSYLSFLVHFFLNKSNIICTQLINVWIWKTSSLAYHLQKYFYMIVNNLFFNQWKRITGIYFYEICSFWRRSSFQPEKLFLSLFFRISLEWKSFRIILRET